MRTRKTLISIAVATMALAAVAGVACTNQSPPTDVIEPASEISGTNNTTSLGMPVQGSEGLVDEMIVIDGVSGSEQASDIAKPGTSASFGIPAPPGFKGRVDEMIVVHGVPDSNPNESDGVHVVGNGRVIEGVGPVPNPRPIAEPTSSTGAVSVFNPDTCEGVLDPPPPTFTLSTRSATNYAKADNPAVVATLTPTAASTPTVDPTAEASRSLFLRTWLQGSTR